jgi:type I restriction enzyme S subunit
MSFARYPTYKDSGVEWLGEVPGHWDISSFRHCLSHMFNGLTATQVDEAENTVPVTRIETISHGVIDESKLGFIHLDEVRADRALLPGDILFSNINSLNMVGKCAFYPGGRTIYAGMNLLVLRPAAAKCYPLWLCWLVRSASFRSVVESLAKPAINQASVSQSSINSITVAVPPLTEQTQIAAFLDRETAKIDGLVAEQRRLMALLKEKRQAVISHAVTQGLNPHAPMKPSGIEWLGDMPAHWSATPIKFVAKVGNGSTPSREVPEYWAETGFPWLNSSVVNSKVVTDPEGFVTKRALRECHLPVVVPPAILVGITGQGRTRGMAAMLGIEATINQHVAYIKPSTIGLNVSYLLSVFESAYLKLRHDSEEAGATKGAITCTQIGNLSIPLPPLAEQVSIAHHLTVESAKFDTLALETQRAIDLLAERRTALISAAVTGQIDIRSQV